MHLNGIKFHVFERISREKLHNIWLRLRDSCTAEDDHVNPVRYPQPGSVPQVTVLPK